MAGDRPALGAGTVALDGREVARIGYGTMGLGRAAHAGKVSRQQGVALLDRALGLGVVAYDTAQFYGDGAANELLREAFGHRRDQVCYIGKVGARVARHGPMPVAAAQRPEELREQLELNLTTLGTDHLDVVYMRRMDKGPGLVAIKPSQRVPWEDQLAELVALRDEGKLGAIAMSHVSLEQVRQALPAGIASISNIYNLLDRSDEPILHLAEQHGVVWSPYFPLGGAMPRAVTALRGGTVGDDELVQELAREAGATASQVGLAWLLAHSPYSLVIAGTTSIAHLEQNVAAATVELRPAALQRLDALSGPGAD